MPPQHARVFCVSGLKFLVRLCTDMNLKEADEYANKLKKAEKMQKLREEVLLICNNHHRSNVNGACCSGTVVGASRL